MTHRSRGRANSSYCWFDDVKERARPFGVPVVDTIVQAPVGTVGSCTLPRRPLALLRRERNPALESIAEPALECVAGSSSLSGLRLAAGGVVRPVLVVASLYLLWSAYPGINVLGTLCFLAVMMLLFTAIPTVARGRVGTDAWRWWTAYSFGFVGFALLRALADQDGRPVFYDYPIRLSNSLFGGQPLSERLQHLIPPTSRYDPFTLLMVGTYLSFFAVPTLVALYLGRRQPEALPRYVMATLMVWIVGLIGFYLFPTAPPWMAARDGLISPVYRVDALIIDPAHYAQGLHLVGSNDVAAMPSIHIAQTWLAVLAISVGRRRLLRAAAWSYAIAMVVAVIYLGEHWGIDAAAGIALMALAWSLAPRMVAQRRRRRRSVPVMEPAGQQT